MINLSKQQDFFSPVEHIGSRPIHIVGCGAIGSHTAELLVRMGVEQLHLWDFDTVSEHNIPNQMFRYRDLKELKTVALTHILQEINPSVRTRCHDKGWMGQVLDGHVFLSVDKVSTRREFIQAHIDLQKELDSLSDWRIRLEDAQHYLVTSIKDYPKLLNTLNFTDEEALAATPVSACNTPLAVMPTIRSITARGMANWMNFRLGREYYFQIIDNPFALHSIGI